MKKSIYNYLVKYNEVYLVYNTFSSALVEMDSDSYKRFTNEQYTDKEFDILVKCGLLIKDEKDEKQIVNRRRYNYLDNKKEVIYRILTTTNCNARCFYCFEKGVRGENMTKETAKKTVDFIVGALTKETKTIKINWFGGEPLINQPVIDYITDELNKKTELKKYYSLVTNGSYINEKIIKKIKDSWNINNIQITLDGFEKDYDAIKNYRDKKIGFFSIIDNIHSLLKEKIFVVLRLHYTDNNFENLNLLIEYLSKEFGNNPNLYVYINSLWNVNSLSNEKIFNQEINNKDYKQIVDLEKKIVHLGLASMKNTIKLKSRYGQCMACNIHNFNILPNGDLVKCAEVMYDVIGNVNTGIIDMERNRLWELRKLDTECDDCIFLPMCQGGCRASYFSKMDKCFKGKTIINDHIIWKYECEKNK